MKDIRRLCVDKNATIMQTIQVLDDTHEKVVLVLDKEKLVGIVTDGDVRRWILKKGALTCEVSKMMCKKPRCILEDSNEDAAVFMKNARIEAVPVVDAEMRPINVIFLRDIVEDSIIFRKKVNIPVVVMAGGKGTRLSPYTNILPKPLIPIGETTILERIIDSFRENGCDEFWLTLNYKKNLIKAYFDDKEVPYDLKYVEEENFLGTCGGLRLLQEHLKETFFLSNCDVLLDIDYEALYTFHREKHNAITIVTSLKHFQLPYGVMEFEKGGSIKKLAEKPEYNYQVNTGIYVVEPSVIADIPENVVYDMTDLINSLLHKGEKIGAYPITDGKWKDMGEFCAMQNMLESVQEMEGKE